MKTRAYKKSKKFKREMERRKPNVIFTTQNDKTHIREVGKNSIV